MRNFIICLSFFIGLLFFSKSSYAGFEEDKGGVFEKLRFSGYVQGMPSIDFTRDVGGYNFNNTLHNRLNFRYDALDNLSFSFELRNRIISGDMIKELSPFIVDILEEDRGLIDASYVPLDGDNWVWHIMSDRFFVDWKRDQFQVRVGRQRINWGINTVSNPNDLFNTYSFFDIDYPERPGADAIRLQYFTGDLSRFDFAFSPDEDMKYSTAALLYAFNKSAYDFQVVGGYYRNRLAFGGGWAGSIGMSGFKGEVTVFNDLNKLDSFSDVDVVGSVSFDYIFPNTLYLVVEGLYNGGFKSAGENFFMISEPMRADNIFISQYAVTTSASYSVSPLLSTSLSGSYMPDINAFYISPNITYSVVTNLDASFLAQYFFFDDEDFSTEMWAFFMQVKWSF